MIMSNQTNYDFHCNSVVSCYNSAIHNNPYSQYTLAQIYKKNSYLKYLYWLKKAAYNKSSDAINDLGDIYSKNNNFIACNLYKESANLKNIEGMYNLAMCHINGYISNNDINQGIELLTMSAKEGDDLSRIRLGLCHYNGIGVKIDEDKANEWVYSAIDQANITHNSNVNTNVSNLLIKKVN